MKNIFLAILLYYSFTVSAQKPERCELSYDTIGYCVDGNMVIDYKYKQGSEFSGDAAAVTNYQEKSALINPQGKEVTGFIYDGLVPCYYFAGWFACKLGNNMGIINDKGQEVIPIKYQGTNFQYDFTIDGSMAYFDSNYCFVFAQNGKYGVLNCYGKPLCDFNYDQIWVDYYWIGGTKTALPIALKKDGKITLMHPDGKIDKNIEYDAFLGYWGNECVLRKGKKITFLNANTWTIIKKHVDEEGKISEKLFVAEEGGKKGLIDSMGKICIPIIYNNISWVSFADESKKSLFSVQKEGKWGLYTIDNKEIVPIKYDEIGTICYDNRKILRVKLNAKWAMFDNTGKQISDFKYDDMYCETQNSAHIEIGERKGELFYDGKEVWK